MGLAQAKENVVAGDNVLLNCRGQGHVVQPKKALQRVAEVLGQSGLAPRAVVALGPIPGAQVCLGHNGHQQQQGLVDWAFFGPCKQLLVHDPGYAQQRHAVGEWWYVGGGGGERMLTQPLI